MSTSMFAVSIYYQLERLPIIMSPIIAVTWSILMMSANDGNIVDVFLNGRYM